MTVKECYALFGGDYDDVLGRLMKDERIVKYLKMLANGDDYNNMHAALSEKRYEDAFRAVHNLKGISLNLGLAPLARTSSELCEALRGGAPTVDVSGMLAAVDASYRTIIDSIALIG